MGITYIGPIDGHNVNKLVKILNDAKKLDHPVLIHVFTKKGKGYSFAEKSPSKFHGITPFDKKTGKLLSISSDPDYSEIASKTLVKEAKNNKDIIAVTAAMPDGTGMSRFKANYPERFFDVGIAEAHAVTFAAGAASAGMKPYVAVYSSFLQRAYDQILHDVCIQNLPVTFLIDRAGIVGSDGDTHQGVFDISYLSMMPNMSIIAPKNRFELEEAIKFSTSYNAPLAIRYGRGKAYTGLSEYNASFEYGKSEVIYEGSEIAVIAVGNMMENAKEAVGILKKKGYSPSLINARFVKPIDMELIQSFSRNHKILVTVEEGQISGGYGEKVLRYVSENNIDIKVVNIGIGDKYVPHGSVDILRKNLGLDADSIAERIISEVK